MTSLTCPRRRQQLQTVSDHLCWWDQWNFESHRMLHLTLHLHAGLDHEWPGSAPNMTVMHAIRQRALTVQRKFIHAATEYIAYLHDQMNQSPRNSDAVFTDVKLLHAEYLSNHRRERVQVLTIRLRIQHSSRSATQTMKAVWPVSGVDVSALHLYQQVVAWENTSAWQNRQRRFQFLSPPVLGQIYRQWLSTRLSYHFESHVYWMQRLGWYSVQPTLTS